MSITGDSTLAEDLTQETFLRAQRARDRYRGDASVKTWLFSIALNLARDHFRAAARRGVPAGIEAAEDLPSAELGAELAAMQKEMSSCIGRYVLQLPGQQRDVVAMHDMGGLGHAQIARHLGISEGNARVLLHRGRAALRRILEEHCILSFDDQVPCEPRPRD
ncbi:MAG: RNA polymerase sigma factor [Rhodospirillales bacterium]|nr:MAG: RNA polymerase sigma factor [Rhodospirillales bacterium]